MSSRSAEFNWPSGQGPNGSSLVPTGGDTPLERRIEYDLYYIRNWSLAFDLKILLLTVLRVFRDASAH